MAAHDELLTPADRRAFWRWVAISARPYLGWILLALGAVAIFFGWFGVSGQSLTAKQLPYLVSGGLTGVALIVVGALFLATDHVRRQIGRLDGMERKVDDLYALLVLDPPTGTTTTTDADADAEQPSESGFVALAAGTTFHRPSCALVAGKTDVAPVDATEIVARSLTPCPVCEPAAVGKSH
jgi:hypothetical protein